MDLARPPVVRWLVVPSLAVRTFGALYGGWALMKSMAAVAPRIQCGGPPPQAVAFAVASGVVENAIGVAVAGSSPGARRVGALVGTGFNAGLVGFAFIADARGVPVKGCGCFGAFDLPWPAHAAIAGALAVAFLAILLDAERRRAACA